MTLQQASLAIQAISAILTFVAIVVALFGDWLRARFHLAPEAKLQIELSSDHGYHGGWIWDAIPGSDERVQAHFFRARITNVGMTSADSVSLSLTRLECLTNSKVTPIKDTAMPLRWSDSWRFVLGPSGRLPGGQANLILPSLPRKASKYCDVCFFYDLGRPEEQLGNSVKRKQVYFAVENLPANNYSMTSGRYLLGLHLDAANAEGINVTYKVDINWEIADDKSKVSFEKN